MSSNKKSERDTSEIIGMGKICYECHHFSNENAHYYCKKKKEDIVAPFNKCKCRSWKDWYLERTKKEEEK